MAARKHQITGKKSKQRQKMNRRGGVMVFTRRNYLLLIMGLILIVAGYVIMRLDNQVDGFVSLYVAPLILLAGYLEIIYAILWRPEKDETDKRSVA